MKNKTFTLYSGISLTAWNTIWKNKNLIDKDTNATTDIDFAFDYSYDFNTGKYDDIVIKISNIPLDAFLAVRDEDYEDDSDFESIITLTDSEKINKIKQNELFIINLFPYKEKIKIELIEK